MRYIPKNEKIPKSESILIDTPSEKISPETKYFENLLLFFSINSNK